MVENTGFEDLNRLLPQPLESAALKSQWLKSPAVRRFELGVTTAVEITAEFIAEWGIDAQPDTFLAAFFSWPKGFFPQARELLEALRQRYRVGCLSNANALHWQKFEGFRGVFDIALSSHLLGAIKPDRDAFERALAECDAAPNKVYFFDDSLPNVLGAEDVGMRSFHVEGIDAVKTVLAREGLI